VGNTVRFCIFRCIGINLSHVGAGESHLYAGLANYNRTLAAWNWMKQQIKDFNAVLTKNNLQQLTVPSTRLTNASCSFIPEQSGKVNK
jgi:hypothetical protein